MSKANATETDILAIIFNATALPWTAIGSIWIALYTADPGEAGTAVTNEATYTNYARVAVARTSGGWTVSGNTASNVALAQFPQCGVTGNTITHVGLVTTSSGAGQLLYSGALNDTLAVANLIVPQFAASALSIVED